MGNVWLIFRKRDVRRVLYFILLGFMWVSVSWGLAATNSLNTGMVTFKPILQTKILLIAALFGGRYLFFPAYRWRLFFKWSFFLLFLLISGGGLVQAGEWPLNGLRFVLQIGDYLGWAIVLGGILELIAAVLNRQNTWDEVNPGILHYHWQSLSRDLIRSGIFMTISLGILYYYLVNIFLVNIYSYSFILLIPFLGCGGAIFGTRYYPVWSGLNKAIQSIDVQMNDIIKTGETECREILPWYQFLVLSRNYLEKLKRPGMLLRIIIAYLLCTALILLLPYLLGFAIEA